VSTAPLHAAVFDFAGVVTQPISKMQRRTLPEGLDGKAIRDVLKVVMAYGDSGSPWAQVERGEVTLADFSAQVDLKYPGLGAYFDGMTESIKGLLPRPEMLSRIRRIRESGVKTALLTNNVAEFRPIWSASTDLDGLFDHVVDSSAVGMRKPEARIFHHVLGLLGVAADNAIFLDDMAINVEGAIAVGMQSLLVGDDDAHFDVLDQLFGL
jgi:putative hydrolase of the HAD superfamily